MAASRLVSHIQGSRQDGAATQSPPNAPPLLVFYYKPAFSLAAPSRVPRKPCRDSLPRPLKAGKHLHPAFQPRTGLGDPFSPLPGAAVAARKHRIAIPIFRCDYTQSTMPICQYCPPEKQVNRAAGSSHNSHLATCPHKKQKIAAAQAAAREREERERAEEERLAAERAIEQSMEDIQEPPRPPTPVQFRVSDGRPIRKSRLPRRYEQPLPEPLPRAPVPPPAPAPDPDPHPDDDPPRWVVTKPNKFGVYKVYPRQPTHDPDRNTTIASVCRTSELAEAAATRDDANTDPWHSPFPNSTQAEYMRYHVLVDNKNSIPSGNMLLDLMRDPAFKAADLDDFTVEKGFKILDGLDETPPGAPPNAWKRGSVTLRVPPGRSTDKDILEITLEDIFYRSPLDIIREVFCTSQFDGMHTTPFSLRWDPKHKGAAAAPDAYAEAGSIPRDECGLPVVPPGHQELYGEMFTAHRTLQSYAKLPDCEEEAVIVSLMPYSDGTSLAQFGTASLQPGYLFIGNQPKSERGKPSVHAAHHFVYFPTLPDDLDEIFLKHYGHNINADIKAHLKRELFHAVWELILDDEFVEAFHHGFPEDCWDKIRRRFFPRFSIYSTDYMEKILAATIKFLARRPCPRCLVLKTNIPRTGMESDWNARQSLRRDDIPWRNKVNNARKKIFEGGRAVNGTSVNNVLGENSFVPVKNAFQKLGEPDADFNLFEMFVPDLLHEIELGVFKSIFIHMIRVLYATDKRNVSYLDERFRKILPFGRTTIRRFTGNVSEMKKMAARDFEDILQCLLPVCEGLFGEFDELVRKLVFQFQSNGFTKQPPPSAQQFASLHAIPLFSKRASFLGSKRHARRAAAQAAKRAARGDPPANNTNPSTTQERLKTLNLHTYKFHCLPDYPLSIPIVGTTDSTSTQPGELAHTKLKRLWGRTNRQRNFVKQIATHERRIRTMRSIFECKHRRAVAAQKATANPSSNPTSNPPARKKRRLGKTANFRKGLRLTARLLPYTPAAAHHYISDSTRNYWELDEIPGMAIVDSGDAVSKAFAAVAGAGDEIEEENFLVNCRSHIRWCLEGKPDPKPEYTAEQLLEVDFRNNRMYPHATCKVNFTTYDMQRDQDIISPRTRPNVMLRSEDLDDSHPYWYARVLSVLHADVKIPGMASYQRIEYLFVRWYTRHPRHRCLPDHPGMPLLSFVPFGDPANEAFGFVDPDALIRGSHIIPAFEHGQTDELLPPSAVARPASDEDQDWNYYYVNGVVDRDIFMRYQRDAVGHGEVWEGTTAPLILGREGVDEMDEDASPEGEDVPAEDEEEDESEEELDDFWDSEIDEDEERGEDEAEAGASGDEDVPLVGDDAEYDFAGIDPS
ncbi:hypothetical protein MKEN_00737900 [Mycena kentingensis (nom. inval.)]|nr:hypothetical protein MKEN_00737900 [Mycena kentingensis (nom. inval.)]